MKVLIVGCGPAGAAAALSCSAHGLETLVVEKGGKRRKICGGLLSVPAIKELQRIAGQPPLDVYSSPKELRVRVRFEGVEIPLRGVRLLNISREKMDEWLSDHVREKCELLEAEVRKLKPQCSCVKVLLSDRTSFVVDYVIGADGVFSAVARSLGFSPRLLHIIQQRLRKRSEPFYELWIFGGRIFYSFPKGRELVVGLGFSKPGAEVSNVLEAFLERIEAKGEIITESWPVPCDIPFLGEGRILLAGDAAGLCNPLSGEGIRFALRSGRLAAKAVAEARDPAEAYAHSLRDLCLLVRKAVDLRARVESLSEPLEILLELVPGFSMASRRPASWF